MDWDGNRGEKRERRKNGNTGKVVIERNDGNGSKSGIDSEVENLSAKRASSFIDSPMWLSTKDAAIYLRKFRKIDGSPSEGAIRTAIWRGELKARKWRRRIYIRRTDLDRLIQNAPSARGGYGWA